MQFAAVVKVSEIPTGPEQNTVTFLGVGGAGRPTPPHRGRSHYCKHFYNVQRS